MYDLYDMKMIRFSFHKIVFHMSHVSNNSKVCVLSLTVIGRHKLRFCLNQYWSIFMLNNLLLYFATTDDVNCLYVYLCLNSHVQMCVYITVCIYSAGCCTRNMCV